VAKQATKILEYRIIHHKWMVSVFSHQITRTSVMSQYERICPDIRKLDINFSAPISEPMRAKLRIVFQCSMSPQVHMQLLKHTMDGLETILGNWYLLELNLSEWMKTVGIYEIESNSKLHLAAEKGAELKCFFEGLVCGISCLSHSQRLCPHVFQGYLEGTIIGYHRRKLFSQRPLWWAITSRRVSSVVFIMKRMCLCITDMHSVPKMIGFWLSVIFDVVVLMIYDLTQKKGCNYKVASTRFLMRNPRSLAKFIFYSLCAIGFFTTWHGMTTFKQDWELKCGFVGGYGLHELTVMLRNNTMVSATQMIDPCWLPWETNRPSLWSEAKVANYIQNNNEATIQVALLFILCERVYGATDVTIFEAFFENLVWYFGLYTILFPHDAFILPTMLPISCIPSLLCLIPFCLPQLSLYLMVCFITMSIILML